MSRARPGTNAEYFALAAAVDNTRHLETRDEYRQYRRLDSLCKLIEGDGICAAAAVDRDTQQIIITHNENTPATTELVADYFAFFRECRNMTPEDINVASAVLVQRSILLSSPEHMRTLARHSLENVIAGGTETTTEQLAQYRRLITPKYLEDLGEIITELRSDGPGNADRVDRLEGRLQTLQGIHDGRINAQPDTQARLRGFFQEITTDQLVRDTERVGVENALRTKTRSFSKALSKLTWDVQRGQGIVFNAMRLENPYRIIENPVRYLDARRRDDRPRHAELELWNYFLTPPNTDGRLPNYTGISKRCCAVCGALARAMRGEQGIEDFVRGVSGEQFRGTISVPDSVSMLADIDGDALIIALRNRPRIAAQGPRLPILTAAERSVTPPQQPTANIIESTVLLALHIPLPSDLQPLRAVRATAPAAARAASYASAAAITADPRAVAASALILRLETRASDIRRPLVFAGVGGAPVHAPAPSRKPAPPERAGVPVARPAPPPAPAAPRQDAPPPGAPAPAPAAPRKPVPPQRAGMPVRPAPPQVPAAPGHDAPLGAPAPAPAAPRKPVPPERAARPGGRVSSSGRAPTPKRSGGRF